MTSLSRDVPRLCRAAIEASSDAFVIFDAVGTVVEWTGGASEIFGWSAAEVLGKKLPAGSLPESLFSQPAQAPGPANRGSQRLDARRRGGDVFTAEMQLTPVEIDGRRYIACFIRDISELLLAEQQLIQAQKLESIGHLTGGLAHDFNNVLGIIIGSLDLVMPAVTGAEERELIEASIAAAQRGAEVTRALLAVARRRALKPQPVNVNGLIDEISPLLRQSAGKKVEVSFSANAIEAVCNIDAGGLNNALVNLVINARDAMPDGGSLLVYAYSTEILPQSLSAPLELKPGPYLVIGVDDSGVGMAPEVAMRAFDPFFTTKERGQGTGLGLAMVYGFARQSGGTARIQSAPGRGTSVQLLLPAMPSGSKAGEPGKSAGPAPLPAARGRQRILLVDDEPDLLRIGREWLRDAGYLVTTAAAASEALARLGEGGFDLLVTDIVMPGALDGLALVERCHRLYPEMPVLLTTGYARDFVPGTFVERPVLEKPYTRATLAQAIADALRDGPDRAGRP